MNDNSSPDDISIHTQKENLEFFAAQKIESNIPIDVNFGTDETVTFNNPLPQNQPAPLEQPYGFLKNIYHGGLDANLIANVAEWSNRREQDLNPIDDEVGSNYHPDPVQLEGLDSRYSGYVMQATGPKDFLRRKNFALDKMEENRRISNGSFAGQLLGGFTIGAVDPTILVPISRAFKYATASQTFLQAVPKVLPGVAISSLSHESIMQATKLGGNLEDFFINSFAGTVLGTVFMGAIPAASSLVQAMKVHNATGVIKMMGKGIEPRPVLNEKGVLKGWKATPMDSSVGAAEVDMAQAYLDGAMAKNSLYAIPYFGETIGYAAGRTGQILGGWISPQVRMANSQFNTIKGLFGVSADHGFETAGMMQGRARPDTFETEFNEVKGINKGVYYLFKGNYLKRNGIDFTSDKLGSRTRADIEGMIKQNKKEDWVTEETFGREVQYAMIEDKPSEHAAVNEMVSIFRDIEDKAYIEYRALNGLPEKIFPLKTARGHLVRAYNHPFLVTEQGEQSWINNSAIELKKMDDEIQALTAPIENAKMQYERIKNEHDVLARTGITTYYRGSNDNKYAIVVHPDFGKGYWISPDKEYASQFGKNLEIVEGKFNIYDMEKGTDSQINNVYKKLFDIRNITGEEQKKLGLDKFGARRIKLVNELIDLLKKKGYEGLMGKDYPGKEIMLFEKPNSSPISNEEIKKSSENLSSMRKHIQRLENNLQDEIRNNFDIQIHAEDLMGVSATEARQIQAIKKPIQDLEKDYQQQKSVVDNLKQKSSTKIQSSRKAKTKKTAETNVQAHDEIKVQLEQEEIKLNEFKDKLDQAKLDLEDKMANKEIDEALYYKIPNSNRYALKDETNRLKLRKVFESDFHRQVEAKAQYDSIMNNTSEDLINNVLYGLFPNLNPNPVKPRSIMYRDKFLYDNNFLHSNPAIAVMNYNLALGRQNSFKRMLNKITVNGEAKELTDNLYKEYENFKQEIRQKYQGNQKKIEKEFVRLNKRYKVAQEDMRNTFDKMLGKNKGGVKLRQYTTMANLFAVSTKLGFLPFTMSTDLMANVFKHGFWPFIKHGLFPMLKGLGGIINTEEGKAIRENAAHALLADNQLALTFADRNWMGAAQDYTPIQGKLMNGFEKLAHYSMNFSGANYVQNLNEMWSAMIIQSKIMNSMNRFLKGELKEGSKDYRDLLKYGIDPKEWAERFMKGWEESGKATAGSGSYLAKYWEWTDKEAANRMSRSINRAVKDTIIRRGMFDAPFAMDNPLINSLLLFKGYVFASLNRYLVPLLQRPDADKITGTLFMLSVGATQNPLRRIINGKDPMEEEDHMLRNAIRDGGVFSIIGDTYEDLNFVTSGYFQNLVSNERYRNRLEMGVFNGPIGGIANDTSRIIGMGLSGEINQNDLKRLTTLIPFANSWQFRALNNKMIESTNYPKTRTEARKLKG